MAKSEIKLITRNGNSIFVHCWEPIKIPNNPVIVQIVHGMAEHGGRYDEFARFLVDKGFIVYANDHRGHGQSVGDGVLGYFADTDGWNLVLDDLYIVNNYIQSKYPKGRTVLLGHSMGSFLARRFTQCYSVELSGLILSGTGWDNGILGAIGIGIAKLQMWQKGDKYPSTLLNRLSFGDFNKAFKPTKTAFDWLSRDNKKVEEYIEDPYCGFVFTARGFYDLLRGIKELHKEEELKKTPIDLPICIFSGALDPVSKDGEGVKKVYDSYLSLGCRNITLKLYDEGRHEMLNEINRYEVYKDILNWINLKVTT